MHKAASDMTRGSRTPLAVLDVLDSLLEAEQGSIFLFLEEGSPYLNRASAELRRPLHQMMKSAHRRIGELSAQIEQIGGVPAPGRPVAEEQYLSYLSFKFLLPKLADTERLMIRRYKNAIAAVPEAANEVARVLERNLTEHQAQLEVLEKGMRKG